MRNWIICGSLFAVLTVYSASWTNAAGHSVEAEIIARKGSALTLKRGDGTVFKIHMNGLSKECQIRVKKKFPEPKKTHEEIVLERNQKRLEQLHSHPEEKKKHP